MYMWILCLDLETSGLPKQPRYNHYYDYSLIAYYNNSRVVQIGYVMCWIDDESKNPQTSAEYIITPDTFIITNERFHGITHAIAMSKGINFPDAIALMQLDIKKTSLVVAHNAGFDVNVLLSEMWRAGLKTEAKEFESIPYFCTSLRMKHIMKLPMRYRNKRRLIYKQPNLGELYKWLFGCPIDDSTGRRHTALFDAEVLIKCFLEMLNKKLFTLT